MDRFRRQGVNGGPNLKTFEDETTPNSGFDTNITDGTDSKPYLKQFTLPPSANGAGSEGDGSVERYQVNQGYDSNIKVEENNSPVNYQKNYDTDAACLP
jgi:hypothetical protein